MRYLPGKAFPPYAFLPGRDPHPTRDPEGHSFGREEEAGRYLPPARWRENEPYLFGELSVMGAEADFVRLDYIVSRLCPR